MMLSDDNIILILLDTERSEKPTIRAVAKYPFSEKDNNRYEVVKKILSHEKLVNLPCYCVVGDDDYQLLLVETPDVPKTEVREALQWKIKDMINIELNNVVIDVFDHPEKKMSYVVATERKVVEKHIEITKELGLDLKAIDIPELTMRNILDHYSSNAERGVALISLKRGEGKLLIIRKGNIYFSRRFSLTYESEGENEFPEDMIVLELQRSLDYYERQMGQVSPAEIIFTGSIEKDQLSQFIVDNFQQKISHLSLDDLFINFGVNENVNMPDELMMLVGGAALRQGSMA